MAQDIIRGRQVVSLLTNKSGGQLVAGDVVIVDGANAEAVTTTTVPGYAAGGIAVAVETIENDAAGRFCIAGYVPVVNLASAAGIKDFLFTHTIAGQAAPSATVAAGAFGQALSAGSTPSASIFGTPVIAVAGASVPWGNLTDVPSVFTPDAHTHAMADITDPPTIPANLNDLGDIDVAGVQDGDALVYDLNTQTWIPGEVSGGATTRILTLGRSGTLTATAGTVRLYVPWACTITNVRTMVGTAPVGASLIADLNIDGTTAFTTQGNRPTIAASAYADLDAVPDVTAISANSYLTLDVDQIGSGTAGSDIIMQVEVTIP